VEAVLAEQLAGSDGGNSNAHQGAQTEEASMNGAAGHEVAIVDAAEAEQRYQRQRERVMEICVGIIGNLSSHAHLAVVLAKEHPALVELLTEGLMLCSSSTPILTELCRLGSVALRMPVSSGRAQTSCSVNPVSAGYRASQPPRRLGPLARPTLSAVPQVGQHSLTLIPAVACACSAGRRGVAGPSVCY
jgi:hypothetical protein